MNLNLKNKLVNGDSLKELKKIPENKKFSWEDLKKIRQKIKDLNITI